MADDGWDSGGESSQPVNTYWSQPSYSNDNQRQQPFRGRGNSDRGWRGSGNRESRGRGGMQNKRDFGPKTTMTVNSSMVGKIIGKGGSMIRELQENSGANIKVNKDGFGTETEITISGSEDARNKAKSLIEDLTNQGYGGRNQNYRNIRQDYSNQAEESNSETPSWLRGEAPEIDFEEIKRLHDIGQREKWEKCPPIVKVFYEESEEVANLTPAQVQKIRTQNNKISVGYALQSTSDEQPKIPNPVTTFEQAFFNYPDILDEIYKQGFNKPSPIQCQSWPILMSGMDMIGIAQTGTGKTLAFLLPALIHIDGQPVPREERGGPNVLILAPTRELAIQIEKEANKYNYKNIKSVCIYGGSSRENQVNAVESGVEIVIATPGRLNDLLSSQVLCLKSVTYLVLDEADRMLDMGFEPQIRKSLYDIRPDRQTVMTSATWPSAVRRLAESFMKDPINVTVGSLDLEATKTVSQSVEIMKSNDEKEHRIMEFIHGMAPDDKVLIFMGTKARADDLASDLNLAGVFTEAMHGNKDQFDRERALEDFKNGDIRVLVATDLASRGLDICDVTHIINYDFPHSMEEYVHRVGRTGRAGKSGQAISFFTRDDWAYAKELIEILDKANQDVPEELYGFSERFEAMKKRREEEGGGNSRGGRGGRGGGRRRW